MIKKNIISEFLFYLVVIVIIFFQSKMIISSKMEVSFYKVLLSNVPLKEYSIMKEYSIILRDTLSNDFEFNNLYGKGICLISTISPKDCGSCLEDEIEFLKYLRKNIPALQVIVLIEHYYGSNKEISPWIKDYGIEYPYYFDVGGIEDRCSLKSSLSWNFIVKDGKIITSFLPPKGRMEKKICLNLLREYVRMKI